MEQPRRPRSRRRRREAALAARHAGVSLLGFAVDAVALKLALAAGLEPAWARVISLALAMHATFLLNGLHVFGTLKPGRAALRQWAAYMAANGFGNLCNYWIFITLVSTHWRIVAEPWFALPVASAAAWAINYSCTRWLVFGQLRRLVRPDRAPSPAAPGSARR